MSFSEFQTVRIRAVRADAGSWTGDDDDAPRPRVGDHGTIVDVETAADGEALYTVEQHVVGSGDRWIEDFLAQDLEAVDAASDAAWWREAEASATSLDDSEGDSTRAPAVATTGRPSVLPEPDAIAPKRRRDDSSPPDSTSEPAAGLWSGQVAGFWLMALLAIGLYLAAGGYGLFVAVAPTTWLGAAWRAALLMGGLIVFGDLLVGGSLSEALVSAFFVAITFFVLGGLTWASLMG